MRSPRSSRWVLLSVSVGILACIAVWLSMRRDSTTRIPDQKRHPANRPIEVPADGYVGSDACRSCHAHNHRTWHASYHRTMTQVPTPDNVVADFSDVTLRDAGKTYRLQNHADVFTVAMDDPDWNPRAGRGPRTVRQIVLMTGSHHEQDFWYETRYGRQLGRLPFVYRIAERKWIPDTSVLMTPPGSPRGFGNWNRACIKCHTTMGLPRLDDSGYVDSKVAEFGISCEACHGPGETHVRYQIALRAASDELPDELKSYAGSDDPIRSDKIVNPATLESHKSAQVCGQCHGVFIFPSESEVVRWKQVGYQYRPGDDLSETRVVVRPNRLREQPSVKRRLAHHPEFLEERFWSDGMVRIVGREYNGLLESPCFQRGELTCLSCHTLHPPADDPRPLRVWANDQLKLGMETNQACVQCHATIGENLTAHTHHPSDSSGSRCYNCHMPPTTYGLLKAVHSHHIESPRVAVSVSTGRPNGCNLCHLDKSLAWTNRYLGDWYGAKPAELTDVQSAVPATVIWSLSGDAGQRALMAWAMGWPPAQEASGADWQARFLAVLLADPYDAVRFIAHRSLCTTDGFSDFDYDFVESDFQAARQRAIEQWRKQRQQAGQSVDARELIKDPAGEVPEDIFDRLLKHRDDRRVHLAE